MNISLRRANAVQNAIQETIKSIRLETMVELNEFQTPEDVIKLANDALFVADGRRQKLLLAYYNIRGLVGTANASSGIDVNLAKAAFIDRRIVQLEELAACRPLVDLAVIKGRLEKIRNRKEENTYHRDNTVATSVIAQEQIDQARSEIKRLKKEKQKINDEVLELNIKTEIPLSDDVVQTLQTEGIL